MQSAESGTVTFMHVDGWAMGHIVAVVATPMVFVILPAVAPDFIHRSILFDFFNK